MLNYITRNLFRLLLILVIFKSSVIASNLGHMGRLVDNSGTPLTGTANLKFEVHYSNDLTSTGLLCSIDMADVPLNNGIYNANLDFSSPLASGPNCNLNDLLKNTPAAETLVIRVKETNLGLTFDWQNILHVPAALRSEVAETAESVLDGAITAPKLNQMGASNNQVLTWNGSAWVPADLPEGNAGTVTSVGAGDGLSSGGTAADPVLNVNVDGTSMEIATDVLQVKDLGISTAKIADDAVTPAKIDLNTNQFDPLAPVLSLILDTNGAIGSGVSGLGVLTNPSFLEITTNQLTLANSGVTPGTYTSVTVDEKGRVTSAGSVSSSDLPFIESLETACANGEIYVANTGLVSCQRHLDFIRIGSATNYVELRVPGAHTGTSVLTFPSTGGAANQVLTTDGTGVLSWQSPATSATPSGAAGGDLAGTYPNPTIATGAVTYAKTNFADGDIPQAKVNGLTTSLAGKEDTISAGTTAQYWRGDKSWQTLDTTAVPEGTNLYYTTARARADAVVDAIVDGVLNIAPSQNAVFDALATKADSTSLTNYVAISGSNMTGPLGLNAQNQVQFRDGDSSNYVALRAPTSVAANIVFNLPAADGSAGQVLSTDGLGNMSWTSSGAGSVTNVTATLPLASSGGTTPNLSITQANTTTNGFLSSTDWNTFNNKEPAVAAGTSAQYRRGDKTWQTLNTSIVPEGANLYYTTTRARADVVADTIVDGVLNVAPSQNAVFDALALKANASSLSNYVLKAGDTMTGALNLPANGLAVGTNQLVTVGGNVGIGTTTPSALSGWQRVLDVHGVNHSRITTTQDDGLISVENGLYSHSLANNGYAGYPLGHGGVGLLGTLTNNDVGIISGNTTRVHIGKNGNIGIGTINPVAKLDIEGGDLNFNTNRGITSDLGAKLLTGTGGLTWQTIPGDTTAASFISNNFDGTPAFGVYANGRVGIGTSSPSATLSIQKATTLAGLENAGQLFNASRDSDAWGSLRTSSIATIIGATDSANNGWVGTQTNHNFAIRVNNNEKVNITPSGNVGIGTNSPLGDGNDLTLGNTSGGQGALYLYGNTANAYSTILTTNGNLHIDAGYGAGATGDGVYLNWFRGTLTHVGNGAAGYGTIRAAAFTTVSDQRLKRDIKTIDDSLQKVLKLRGVEYYFSPGNYTKDKQLGLIAQEVREIFPETIIEDEDGLLSVNYTSLVAPLIEATKQQQEQIDANRVMLQTMQNVASNNSRKIASLEKEVEDLKRQNESLNETVFLMKEALCELSPQKSFCLKQNK